jgi:hypothetical protein
LAILIAIGRLLNNAGSVTGRPVNGLLSEINAGLFSPLAGPGRGTVVGKYSDGIRGVGYGVWVGLACAGKGAANGESTEPGSGWKAVGEICAEASLIGNAFGGEAHAPEIIMPDARIDLISLVEQFFIHAAEYSWKRFSGSSWVRAMEKIVPERWNCLP